MGLAAQGGEPALLGEDFRNGGIIFGQVASDGIRAVLRRVMPRQHGTPRGGAHRVAGVGPVVGNPVLAKGVEVGRADEGIVPPQRVPSLLVRSDEKDVFGHRIPSFFQP